jgi:hypothetical protein
MIRWARARALHGDSVDRARRNWHGCLGDRDCLERPTRAPPARRTPRGGRYRLGEGCAGCAGRSRAAPPGVPLTGDDRLAEQDTGRSGAVTHRIGRISARPPRPRRQRERLGPEPCPRQRTPPGDHPPAPGDGAPASRPRGVARGIGLRRRLPGARGETTPGAAEPAAPPRAWPRRVTPPVRARGGGRSPAASRGKVLPWVSNSRVGPRPRHRKARQSPHPPGGPQPARDLWRPVARAATFCIDLHQGAR